MRMRFCFPLEDCMSGDLRQRNTAGGEQLFPFQGTSVSCSLHPDFHRAAGGAGQGQLRAGGNYREGSSAGGRTGGGDEPERRLRHSGAGLHRGKRVGEGGQDHSELYGYREPDGVEEGIEKQISTDRRGRYAADAGGNVVAPAIQKIRKKGG